MFKCSNWIRVCDKTETQANYIFIKTRKFISDDTYLVTEYWAFGIQPRTQYYTNKKGIKQGEVKRFDLKGNLFFSGYAIGDREVDKEEYKNFIVQQRFSQNNSLSLHETNNFFKKIRNLWNAKFVKKTKS